MSNYFLNNIVSKYLDAKLFVIDQGYSEEIEWQDCLDIDNITESAFLREASWVILSSGMRETVIRKIFPLISDCFFNWESAFKILENKSHCYKSAVNIFSNEPKINAILKIAEIIETLGFEEVFKIMIEDGVDYISTFPFMGPATSYHFAKNIGLDVAKPDRHLVRIANSLGYNCPQQLCSDISKQTDEKLSVVDLVLWRYAVTDKDYLNFFKLNPPNHL